MLSSSKTVTQMSSDGEPGDICVHPVGLRCMCVFQRMLGPMFVRAQGESPDGCPSPEAAMFESGDEDDDTGQDEPLAGGSGPVRDG